MAVLDSSSAFALQIITFDSSALELVQLFGPLGFAAFGRWDSTPRGLIPAGTFGHLLTDLSLKVLCLTADFIQLVEDRLKFFRR